jgi:MFS transporter, SP family, xylose:H+ symportor
MAIPTHVPTTPSATPVSFKPVYTGVIAFVAALGGLLFGYDWVVIGGAKPFYEVFFSLASNPHADRLIGWATSCALVGCLLGSAVAGALSDRFGRRPVLIASAVLFAVSSILTGWAHVFTRFILWRITGGVAIGLASNVSPIYISEISPPHWRGRLVSLNQLALVVGILLAQIVDWRIAVFGGASNTSAALAWNSWPVQYGWRWMFTAVAIPSAVFLITALLVPESPRWLIARNRIAEARRVLTRLADSAYAGTEVLAVQASIASESQLARASALELLSPALRRPLLIGVTLAVLQQWSGINVLFNYAQEVYRDAGYGVGDILFNIVITGAINLLFTLLAMTLVDRIGRRSLMLFGCLGVGIAHLLVALAYHLQLRGLPVLIFTLCAIACYAMSLAPVTWVIISEIFPNRIRGIGVSAAVSALWAASFLLVYTFPWMNRALGSSGTFVTYGIVCLAGFLFVKTTVPETGGKSLEEIQQFIAT